MRSEPDLGLRGVPTEELENLLRLVYRKEVSCPLSPAELARIGLQHRQEYLLHAFRGLDDHAAQKLLVAVLAERRPD